MTEHKLTTDGRYDYSGKVVENLRVQGRTFHVGYIARGREGRKTQGGAMVPGPWAYAGANAIVIAAHRIEGPPTIEAEFGDTVIIDGDRYRLVDKRVLGSPHHEYLCNDHWLGLAWEGTAQRVLSRPPVEADDEQEFVVVWDDSMFIQRGARTVARGYAGQFSERPLAVYVRETATVLIPVKVRIATTPYNENDYATTTVTLTWPGREAQASFQLDGRV